MYFLVVMLVVLLLALTPLRYGVPGNLPRRWLDWLQQRWPDWRGGKRLLLVLLPLLPLWWLLGLLDGRLGGLPTLLLHLLLVLLAVTPEDPLRKLTDGFARAWWRGDHEAAALIAERDLGLSAQTPEQLLAAVRARVLCGAFQGYLVPLFWYLLLGPLAALACGLLRAEQRRSGDSEGWAVSLLHALDWLPARLQVLCLALVGDFDATLRVWRRYLFDWNCPATQMLSEAAAVAEQSAEPVVGPDAGRRLVLKSLLVWAVLLAFVAILG